MTITEQIDRVKVISRRSEPHVVFYDGTDRDALLAVIRLVEKYIQSERDKEPG